MVRNWTSAIWGIAPQQRSSEVYDVRSQNARSCGLIYLQRGLTSHSRVEFKNSVSRNAPSEDGRLLTIATGLRPVGTTRPDTGLVVNEQF